MTRDRGFALLIVLWTLALLSLLISQLAGSGRQAVRLAGNMRLQAMLQAEADGAVQQAGYHVAAAGTPHWAADGVVHEWRQDGLLLRARVTSEAGKANPSVASLELLAALINGCGVDLRQAATIASAIVAWRFPTAQTGFGADAYRQAGRDYAPPGQPFESLDELGLVLGMTPKLLDCLSPEFSLYRDTDPDPNAADPAMMRAIGQMLGTTPPVTDATVDESVILVAVMVLGPDGARTTRRAVLRMDPQNAGAGAPGSGAAESAAAPFHVLESGS